jgi:multidrug efflux system outer membrane protein
MSQRPNRPSLRCCIRCGLALLLAGCAARSPENRMDEALTELAVPEGWSATRAAKAGVDMDWVKSFRSKTLSALVDEALANNRDMRAAAARLDQAMQQTRIARSAGLPTADLNFGGSRRRQVFVGIPIPGDSGGGPPSATFNQFDLGLGINWEADVWGRIRAGTAAAAADAEAAAADFQAARVSLAANVVRAWLELAESQQQAALADEAERVAKQTAESVRDRFRAGQQDDGGAAAQLRLAETDVATARAAAAERRQLADLATRRLEVLAGRYPAGAAGSISLPALPAKPPAGLPSELLTRRPDLLAAERRFAAAGKRLTEARRALFPRLSLTTNTGTSTPDLKDLLNSEFGVWSLAGNLVQPILTGGRLLAEANVRYGREREALAELQQAVLSAFGEVETALAADRWLAERESAIAEAARQAEAADTEARSDFASGVGDLLTALAAQDRAIRLRSQAIAVRRLRLENRVNLHLALGGGFAL